MNQLHPGHDQLHSVALLFRCDALLLVNWLSMFRNKFANTSPWTEIFLYISTLDFEYNRLSRNVAYQPPSGTT